MKEQNLLLVHGGAPTAVMNASVYGVIKEAVQHGEIGHVYAAIGGSGAILKERFRDLSGGKAMSASRNARICHRQQPRSAGAGRL